MLAGSHCSVLRLSLFYRLLMIRAALNGRLEEVQQLLLQDPSRANTVDGDGDTPLYCAAMWNHYEVAECLLDAGANVNALCSTGTPLYQAASCSQDKKLHMVDLLLRRGADPSIPLVYGRRTPLMQAADGGSMMIVARLLEHPATIQSIDHVSLEGVTAVRSAWRNGRVDVLRVLLEAGADPTVGVHNPLHYRPETECSTLVNVSKSIFFRRA